MIKKLDRLWVVLMILSGVAVLYCLAVALIDVQKFVNLSSRAEAKILQVHIKELPSSRFAFEAEYSYEVDSVLHSGKTIFSGPRFFNRFAAESRLRRMVPGPTIVYYTPAHPSVSSLERVFPHKQCIHALIALGIFLYFYLSRMKLLKFIGQLTRSHDTYTARD